MQPEKLSLLDSLSFRLDLTALNSEADARPLRSLLDRLNLHLSSSNLKGPLYAMIHEIAANSLKALYKKVFFQSLQTDYREMDYSHSLALFRTELEDHNARNLIALLVERKLSVVLSGRREGDEFLIEAITPGEPSEIEKERIERAVERGRRLNSFGFLLMEDSSGEAHREGGSLGIPLIMMSLRSLGLSADSFHIEGIRGQTVTTLRLPGHFFTVPRSYAVRRMRNTRRHLAMVWNTYLALGMGVARFDRGGHLIAVSEELLTQLEVGDPEQFERELPPRFMVDLFHGENRVQPDRPMEHYRIYLKKAKTKQEMLYNVSAFVNSKEYVTVLFHKLPVELQDQRPRAGSLLDHLRLHNMIEPYVPVPLLLKARESLQLGLDHLTDELRDVTVFFGDLAGFTGQTERMPPDTALEFLNIAMSISVRFIEKNGGFVDKFMGDAIMAIFYSPLRAAIAALEIQNQFQQLNYFRSLSDEIPIQVRIGINTGKAILGNVGAANRMDWTAIGDTVNTASRIEKLAHPGEVLVGQSTFEAIMDQAEVQEREPIAVRGKSENLKVYSVRKLRFHQQDRPVEISVEGVLADLLPD
ncbi:MAG: adenylate/guanylate cyclase domain-containing protein [Spirochaetales bacterium]|nr:adenylate/guanylate cyclase domain-containing protein [Spirochaetales bacterium]